MPRRYIILSIIALLVAGVVLALPAVAAFDLSKGIVGNLSEACRVRGDCGWCDFIDLFIVLQKVILSLFGGLALIMIIWGGTGILTSAGNSQKVAEGKKLIVSTLLGVVIILAGYFLIVVLVAILVTPAGNPPTFNLFNQEWRQAYCTPSTSASFCSERGDGTPCTATSGSYTGAGICKGGACFTECEAQFGSTGYVCKDSSTCAAGTIKPGLCPGPETYVCCK